MNNYTPGPWAVHQIKCAYAYVVPQSQLHLPIGGASDSWKDKHEYAQQIVYVDLDTNRRTKECAMANARLISAAPELLAAIQNLLNAAGKKDPQPWRDARQDAAAAIAKATGETR